MTSKKEQERKDNRDQDRQRKEKKRKGPSLLEWISAAIGAAITLAMIGLIVMKALGPAAPAPLISIKPVSVVHERAGYVVKVEVTNRSGVTAAALNLQGELMRGGEAVETSNATLSYLPGESTRRAGLIFARDPRRFELELRATGYEVP